MCSVNRKFFVRVMVLLVLLLAVSSAEAVPHDSFMGVKWGTPIRRFPGVDWDGLDFTTWTMQAEYPDPNKRFTSLARMREIKVFDNFPVSLIMYDFLDNRFAGVQIYFADDAWIEKEAYFEYLVKNFGLAHSSNEEQSQFFWVFDDGFTVVADFRRTIPNAFMMLHLLSPQEAKYMGLVK